MSDMLSVKTELTEIDSIPGENDKIMLDIVNDIIENITIKEIESNQSTNEVSNQIGKVGNKNDLDHHNKEKVHNVNNNIINMESNPEENEFDSEDDSCGIFDAKLIIHKDKLNVTILRIGNKDVNEGNTNNNNSFQSESISETLCHPNCNPAMDKESELYASTKQNVSKHLDEIRECKEVDKITEREGFEVMKHDETVVPAQYDDCKAKIYKDKESEIDESTTQNLDVNLDKMKDCVEFDNITDKINCGVVVHNETADAAVHTKTQTEINKDTESETDK